MIGVTVSNHRPRHRAQRVDKTIRRFNVETLGSHFYPVFGVHGGVTFNLNYLAFKHLFKLNACVSETCNSAKEVIQHILFGIANVSTEGCRIVIFFYFE